MRGALRRDRASWTRCSKRRPDPNRAGLIEANRRGTWTPIETAPVHTSDRNLALELVRVTEAAALAASRWMGRGKKNEADGAAVEAMRRAFDRSRSPAPW